MTATNSAALGVGIAVPFAWSTVHNAVISSVGFTLLTVLVVWLIVMLRRAMSRQRTVEDDRATFARNALARCTTSALYTYARGADGVIRYDWDAVDAGFPLAWRTGSLAGRPVTEMIPAGPAGDEARETYLRVLNERKPGVYLREDTTPDGRVVTMRYTHAPMGDGRGVCEAVPLSPEVDAMRDRADRLAMELAEVTRQRNDLMKLAGKDAVALFEKHVTPAEPAPAEP